MDAQDFLLNGRYALINIQRRSWLKHPSQIMWLRDCDEVGPVIILADIRHDPGLTSSRHRHDEIGFARNWLYILPPHFPLACADGAFSLAIISAMAAMSFCWYSINTWRSLSRLGKTKNTRATPINTAIIPAR